MEPISQVSQVMEALRRQMSDNIDKLRRAGKLAGTAQAKEPANSAAPTTEALPRKVSERIKALDFNDPRNLTKATKVFLESVLLSEFGEELVNDPAFYTLIDDVSSAMLADDQVKGNLNRLFLALNKK